MSDDIVTRLRYIYSQKDVGVSLNPETFVEAADEIEHLRKLLASFQRDSNYWHERCTRAETCADIMHNQINKKWWKR